MSATPLGGVGTLHGAGGVAAAASQPTALYPAGHANSLHPPVLTIPAGHAVRVLGPTGTDTAEHSTHLEMTANDMPHLADVAMKLLRLHELYDSQNLLRPGRALWASVKKMVIDDDIKMKLKRELAINLDEVGVEGEVE